VAFTFAAEAVPPANADPARAASVEEVMRDRATLFFIGNLSIKE
jgi:hypothetical protein